MKLLIKYYRLSIKSYLSEEKFINILAEMHKYIKNELKNWKQAKKIEF